MKNIFYLIIILLFSVTTIYAQDTYTTIGSGDWSDAAIWSCSDTDNDGLCAATPGAGDIVRVVDGYDTQVTTSFEVGSLSITGRGGTSNNVSLVEIFGGVLRVSGDISLNESNLGADGVLAISSEGVLRVESNIINNGGRLVPNITSKSTVIYQGSGNQNIWPVDYSSLSIIKSAGTASLISNLVVYRSLNISAGTFDKGAYDINLKGNLQINSTILSSGGNILFTGSANQNISGSTPVTFADIIIGNTVINNHTGLSISNSIVFTGSSNILDPDGSDGTGILRLLSTAETGGTAYVGEMVNGNTISGNIIVERFISQGENWRYFTSPLSNVTVADWQNEIAITGTFTGATDCATLGLDCNSSSLSLFEYIEAFDGNVSEGYEGFPSSNNSETFERGRGYAIWIRDFDIPVTLDMKGSIKGSTFNFPVTYNENNQGLDPEAVDGWNLVGNPFLSTVTWPNANSTAVNAGWSFNNVYGTVYIKDNYGQQTTAGGYVTHNGTVGTNGWNGTIAMGQAFWVKAFANNPSFSAAQSVKTSVNPEHLFRVSETNDKLSNAQEPNNVLRVYLSHKEISDEAIIHFREGATEGVDIYMDAPKFYNPKINLSTVGSDNEDLVINSLPLNSCDVNVSLSLHDKNPKGDYKLSFAGFDLFESGFQLWLIDNYNNKNVKISEGDTYSFTVNQDPTSFGKDRFRLSFKNISKGSKKSCDMSSARTTLDNIEEDIVIYPNPVFEKLTITLPVESADVEIISLEGRVLHQQKLINGQNLINVSHLNEGMYIIKVTGDTVSYTERIVKE
ncbi:MAG: T9SS type A sorting domain-containing protein [Candidatus Cyclobacteriaceae bacterium M2_1C_046]